MQLMAAYSPVINLCKAGPGINFLAPAGVSTAGIATLQTGRAAGANRIATTRSNGNRGFLGCLGASHVPVDDRSDLAAFLLATTDGVGMHGAFDPVGGDVPKRCGPALAHGGKILMHGMLTEAFPAVPFVNMWQKNVWLHTYSLFNSVEDLAARKHGTDCVHAGLADGRLTPMVDNIFPMAGHVETWRQLVQPRPRHGNVVIETGA